MNLIADIRNTMKKLPRRSVNYFLFCLAGVLIFLFGGIVPAYWNHVDLSKKINEEKRRIEEQGTLQPIFRSLQGLPVNASPSLKVPPRVALPRSEIEQVDASFREIARRLGMKMVSTVPEFVSVETSRDLAVTLKLKGDFENFRNLLKSLGELPQVSRIEEFAIQRSGNSRALDITIKISLAVN